MHSVLKPSGGTAAGKASRYLGFIVGDIPSYATV